MQKRIFWALAIAVLAVLAVIQCASAAIFASAGTPISVPAHLPLRFGTAVYAAIERIAPTSSVEQMLTLAALDAGDLNSAQVHVSRMAPSVTRSELAAKTALARGDQRAAMRDFLAADDIDALRSEVDRLARAGRALEAYDFENESRARLRRSATHPDAVAESYWRSGVLASSQALLDSRQRVQWLETGLSDYRNAVALAPLSEKYLLAAGTQSLELAQYKAARDYFERIAALDPASADAYAGLGVSALHQGDRRAAQAYANRSRSLNPHSPMLGVLDRALR